MPNVIEILVPLLVFVSIVSIGAGIVWARSAARSSPHRRLRELQREFGPGPDRRPADKVQRALGQLARLFGPSPGLKVDLARAGYHQSAAPTVFLSIKVLLLLAGLGCGFFLTTILPVQFLLKVVLAVVPAGLLFFLPNLAVSLRRRRRTDEVRRRMPDMVDLLEVCVAAGMGIDMAWNSVTQEIRRVSGILADEMALTNLEIHLGAPRAEAMRHMSERTSVEELGSLVAMLVQSDRFGTSIGETLKAFAASTREERSMRRQESAEKMAVKLLFPMVLFIFPAMLIVMVGPAAIGLYKVLR
jgi:tight adherence protein C